MLYEVNTHEAPAAMPQSEELVDATSEWYSRRLAREFPPDDRKFRELHQRANAAETSVIR